MRLTNVFDIEKVDRTTLREFSMYQYAHQMQMIDAKQLLSYGAVFNCVVQGLEGKIKMDDIYNPIDEQLILFGQDGLDEQQQEVQDYIYRLNQQFNKEGK